MEEARGDAGFGFQAGGGEDVGVAGFVGAFFEIMNFNPPFGDQSFETIVDFAEADAHSFRERPLREIGIGPQGFEELIGDGVC